MNDGERFETILIECLTAIEAGTTAEQLLARYPAYAPQLAPALRVATRLRSLERSGPAPVIQQRARAAFLARTAAMRPASPQAASARWLLRPLVSFVTALTLVAVVGSGVLAASAASLPGDPLYGVKRSFEDLQFSLAREPLQRANLQESYTRRRAEEVKAVQASKRVTSVQFTASIDAMNGSVWEVGGFTVQVLPGASVHGVPQVGELVQVTGRTRSDGQIVADQIKVESAEFVGIVEAMGTPMWNIGGQRVLVTTQTQIIGAARVGAQAQVHVRMLAEGTWLALKVDFERPDSPATPLPTATPGPRPTSTLRPTQPPKTATPQPAVTREREGDATPESRPTEGHGDNGTPEPKSTEDHGGKDTPEPESTEDHESKDTPEPGSTEDHGSSDPGSPKPDSAGDSVRH